MIKTNEQALIAAPVSDQIPIYLFDSGKEINILSMECFDDLNDFLLNAGELKKKHCEIIELKRDIFGNECLFVYSRL